MTIEELLAAARDRLQRVTPIEAVMAVRHGGVLVDVRSERQLARDGEIPGAIHHPRNVLEWRVDPSCSHHDPRLSQDRSRRLIVVCDEGYQSSLAAVNLQLLGFANATDLVGGFQAWRAAGLPVTHYPWSGRVDGTLAHELGFQPSVPTISDAARRGIL